MENSAWLLKDTNDDYFAVNEVEMVEYIPVISAYLVPATPDYCHYVTAWREYLVPVINFSLLFGNRTKQEVNQVGIFAYQKSDNEPLNYIAIQIQETPEHIMVNDSWFCDLPSRYVAEKKRLAHSCFTYQNTSVPILNLHYLCSTEFRDCV